MEVPSLICTHSLALVLCKREKGGETEKEEDQCLWCFGSYAWGLVSHLMRPCSGHCILVIYIEEVFAGFFPLGFPRVNCCVPCDCISFREVIYVVILKMY